ncbi:hypothetical protein S245_059059, partial [Arachis hypogaea]
SCPLPARLPRIPSAVSSLPPRASPVTIRRLHHLPHRLLLTQPRLLRGQNFSLLFVGSTPPRRRSDPRSLASIGAVSVKAASASLRRLLCLVMATATYPPPPPYYRLYKDYLEDPKSAPEPPPPIEGTYVCFGGTYTTSDVLPSLEEQGVRQLYPKGANVDFKKELRSLNGELQLHILELADILIERPSQYARRVEEISTVFKNLHHLLNSLRPHQARATLIHILELQIERRKEAVEDIKKRREEARRLLNESLATLDDQ